MAYGLNAVLATPVVIVDGGAEVSSQTVKISQSGTENNVKSITGSTTAVDTFPAATPFCDASANASNTDPGGAALASHAYAYEFQVRNTHASQILYLLADANGTAAARYIRTILPGMQERFAGAGNTSSFRLLGSGANTTYILSGY